VWTRPPAPVAGLDDLHRVAELQQLVGGHEARHPGSEDYDMTRAGILLANFL
jgi:hypothetical protein